MKQQIRILAVAISFCVGLALPILAAEKAPKGGEKHGHDHKHHGGPNGGRLLETEPHTEFLVEKDHRVTIRFFTDDLKPLKPAEQSVVVRIEAKDGKSTVEFEKEGDALKSKTKLPDGDGYNVIVQVRAKPNAKPQNFRFKLDLSTCGECKRAEYACTCDH